MGWLCTLFLASLASSGIGSTVQDYASDPSVQLFQEYVQINTTTQVSDLGPAVEFWKTQAESLDLPIEVYEFVEGQPVIVIKWAGANSSLPSIMLNSHMDVVPAEESEWTYPPFSAYLDENGDIWGRGTQDMKSVSIQYFEALKRLKENNTTLLRDVYMTLMPDEEIGSPSGMNRFIESDYFSAMNVGCEMDESAAYPADAYPLFYQDKAVWQIQVDCYAASVHSATFPATNTTAVGKCRYVIDTLLNFRDEQYTVAVKATQFNAGAFTSVNLNKISAGTANNIIPDRASLTFDIRLSTSLNETEFANQLEQWISDAGENVTLTYIEKDKQSAYVILNSTNPYWVALEQSASNLNLTLVPVVSPGATDARNLRLLGVPAFGFSPMANEPTLLHTADERLNVETFLLGIDIYEEIISNLANIPAESTENLPDLVIQNSA